MKQTQELSMTGAERALFAATLEFALHVAKMPEAEAREAAVNKILSKRSLVKRLNYRY